MKDSDGNYYNERMEKEILKRQQFLESRYFNGKKGGRPSKPNSKPNSKPTKNLRENDKEDGNDIVLKEGVGGKIINIPFETFWNLYDKKEDRIKCERKWNNLTNKEREECITNLPAYIRATPNKQYRKNPATYLNNKSWENEVIPLEPTFGIPQKERNYTTPETSFS